jgi:AcrR family transcriptional regulator
VTVDQKTSTAGGGERGSQATTGGRLLTLRGRRTRAGLIAAAKVIFEATPFAETRISDITARAGVATGTFYTYFDSKEEVFREVAIEVLAEMSSSGALDPDDLEGGPIHAVAQATRRYFLTCLHNAGVARSMEQLALSDPYIARARRNTVIIGVKRIEQWIRDLQELGICDTDINAWDTAMVLHTMNVRVAYDHLLLTGREGDVERLVTAVTRVWARTVGLEKPGPGAG